MALKPITKQHLEQAFEAWETGFRVDPKAYRTEEETRGLPVSQVSAERADYFFTLLDAVQAKALPL